MLHAEEHAGRCHHCFRRTRGGSLRRLSMLLFCTAAGQYGSQLASTKAKEQCSCITGWRIWRVVKFGGRTAAAETPSHSCTGFHLLARSRVVTNFATPELGNEARTAIL